jgi:hypothetical protein
MSDLTDDRLQADPLAVARILGAAAMRGSSPEALRGWGAWLDHALAAGFGAADAVAAVPAPALGLTVWGEPARGDDVASLLRTTGAPAMAVTRFRSLSPHASAVGAWFVEDDDGFEGGWALRDVTPLRLRAALPGSGIARMLALAEELGLDRAEEVRRSVNPGGAATEVAWPIAGDAARVLDRALRALLGVGASAAERALVGRAVGPCALVSKAGESGLTAVGVRVPIGDATAIAAGLAAVGASRDDD